MAITFNNHHSHTPVKGSDPFPTSIEEEVSVRSPEKKIIFFCFASLGKCGTVMHLSIKNPVGGGGGGSAGKGWGFDKF